MNPLNCRSPKSALWCSEVCLKRNIILREGFQWSGTTVSLFIIDLNLGLLYTGDMEQPKFEEPTPPTPEEKKSEVKKAVEQKKEDSGPVSITEEIGEFFTEMGEHFLGKGPANDYEGPKKEKK